MYYKSSIRPVIEFASVVFDGCSNREKLRLENVQRRAALVCTGALKRTESVKLLNDLEWESISSRRNNAKLILFYKIMNGKVPAYLNNLLPQNVVCDRYNLRHVVNKTCVKSRLRAYEMSYFPSTIKFWNNLPVNVSSSESVAVFKNRLLEWHSINERNELAIKSHLLPFCAGYYGRLLNQIRYNLSPLRSHLFTYSIVEHPLCPSCHDCAETSKHFSLHVFAIVLIVSNWNLNCKIYFKRLSWIMIFWMMINFCLLFCMELILQVMIWRRQ